MCSEDYRTGEPALSLAKFQSRNIPELWKTTVQKNNSIAIFLVKSIVLKLVMIQGSIRNN